MKILVAKVFILAFIIFISVTSLIFFIPAKDYITSAEYKYELLRETSSPKMIIIGGSNVFAGIDSEKISKEININVVNMGFNFSYGLRYMIEEVEDNINENDIIVLIPEQVLFSKEYFYGSKKVINILLNYRLFNIYYYLRDFKLFKNIFLKNINYVFFNVINNLEEKVLNIKYLFIKRDYNFKIYNKYGDCVFDIKKNIDNKLIGEEVKFINKIFFSDELINFLNKFYTEMNKKNVKVIMYMGCLPDSYYLNNKKNLDDLDEWLDENLKIPKITSCIKQTYPNEYFTDTINHLDSRGRTERTNRLVNDLKLFLENK